MILLKLVCIFVNVYMTSQSVKSVVSTAESVIKVFEDGFLADLEALEASIIKNLKVVLDVADRSLRVNISYDLRKRGSRQMEVILKSLLRNLKMAKLIDEDHRDYEYNDFSELKDAINHEYTVGNLNIEEEYIYIKCIEINK